MQEVKFKLGNIERRVKTPLGLALTIEAATDVGVLSLTRSLARSEARLSHVVEVLRAALASNGMHYEPSEVLDMIEEHEGITGAMTAAAQIMGGLFYRTPQKRAKSAGNAAAAGAETGTAPLAVASQ